MRVQYSGIELLATTILDFERTPVLSADGVDWLYTQFRIHIIGLVSSDQIAAALRQQADETIGTSFVQTGFAELNAGGRVNLGRPPSVEKSPNSNPIITDKAIRHWLTVPRRRLVIENHNPALGNLLLQSPKAGRIVDARNGPFPEVFAVSDSFGDARNFMVNFQVVTYVNECEENVGAYGAFLSNRFSQSHDIDADGFISITTEGEARFRTDLVYGQLNPDTLRPFLFLPIPNGHQRVNIKVEGMSDVSGLRYSFVDQQLPNQLVVGDEINATRAEVTYRQAYLTNEDALGVALNTIDRHYSIAVNSKWAKPDEDTSRDAPKKRRRKKPKKKDDGE